MPREIILPKETEEKIFMLWDSKKSKAAISKELKLCRKKITKILRSYNDKNGFFNVRENKNWLIND